MQESSVIWHNGQLVPWHEANIHVLTHGLHYGSGVFEGIRFYPTAQGSAIFKLAEHIKRLYYSAKALSMDIPFTAQELTDAIIAVAQHSQLSQGYIRPIVYYGYGVMGVNPTGAPIGVAIACWPWEHYAMSQVKVKISRFIRLPAESTITDAKICGTYVNNMLAALEVRGTHYDKVLLLDMAGNLAEGASENIFLVKNGVIYTPQLGNILPGITRATLIKMAEDYGYTVIEDKLKTADILAADEAFFSGTAAEITSIRSLDDQLIGSGKYGSITQWFSQAYNDVVTGKNAHYQQHLTIFKPV